MGTRLTGLWCHPDFLKLWAGQTVSVFGSLITGFALPLVAVLTLAAGPFDLALLGAARVAPALLVGLIAGVWVDRLPRRPLLIGADQGRAVLLASVPATALAGALRLEQLYAVAALTSLLGILFEVAYRAYLPSLVRAEELIEGNSKLEASGSVAEVSGFGLAGILVQTLTAPIALFVDALSFLISALSLALIRTREPAPAAPEPGAARPNPWREAGEGLRYVWSRPVLRALTAAGATGTLSAHIFVAVMMLFLIRELGLEPGVIGVIFAVGGVSAFVGAVLAERVMRRWGMGRTLIGSFFINAGLNLSMGVAAGPPPLVVTMLTLPQLTDGAGTIYGITRTSLIQASTPTRLLGRVHASNQVVEEGAMLLGLLIGGALGEVIGLRPTFLVGVLGTMLAGLWLVFSPLRTLTALPVPMREPTAVPTADG